MSGGDESVSTVLPLDCQSWQVDQWQPASQAGPSTVRVPLPPRLRLATLNILADCFPMVVRMATPPSRRIAYIVAQIELLDADIIGLNEVTPKLLGAIMASAFVRSQYTVTELNTTPHGCVILSRVPIVKAFALPPFMDLTVPLQKIKRGPVAIDVGGLVVCSMHTVAYQTTENREMRRQQMKQAADYLREYGRRVGSTDFVIMGDLNLHDLCEDKVVVENQLLDCWAETHPNFTAARDMDSDHPDAGFTFDAKKNAMIPRYIPGEHRRMRLDRILVNRGMGWAPAAPCRMWATDAVDAKRDIYASDHYGLAIDLQRAEGSGEGEQGWQGSPTVAAELAANGALPPGPRGFSWIKFGFAVAGHSAWLAMRGLGLR